MLEVFACGIYTTQGCSSIWDFLYKFLIPTLIAVGIGLAAISFVVSAISIITSAGDEKLSQSAYEQLQGNIIGTVVLLLAFTIFSLIIDSITGGASISSVSNTSNFLTAP